MIRSLTGLSVLETGWEEKGLGWEGGGLPRLGPGLGHTIHPIIPIVPVVNHLRPMGIESDICNGSYKALKLVLKWPSKLIK